MVQLSDIYRGKNSDNKNCGFGWLFLSYTDVSKKANNRLKFVNQDIEGKTLIPAARRHTVGKKKGLAQSLILTMAVFQSRLNYELRMASGATFWALVKKA